MEKTINQTAHRRDRDEKRDDFPHQMLMMAQSLEMQRYRGGGVELRDKSKTEALGKSVYVEHSFYSIAFTP